MFLHAREPPLQPAFLLNNGYDQQNELSRFEGGFYVFEQLLRIIVSKALSPTIDAFLTNCLPDYIVVLSLAKQSYLVMEGDNNCTTDYQITFLVR